MPAIIVATWGADRQGIVDDRFAVVQQIIQRTPHLSCSSDETLGSVRVARITHQHSRHMEVQVDSRQGFLAAAAGWCFRRGGGAGSPLNLLREYRDAGEQLFDRVDGQYALVAASPSKATVSCDRGGLYPCYVAEFDGTAWASTSAVALAAALGCAFDRVSLQALWLGTAVRSPRSLFQGIRRLGFGEQAELSEGRAHVRRVWSPFQQPFHHDVRQAAEEGVELLGKACEQAHRDYPGVCCDLTSGMDTRLLVSGFHHRGLPVAVNVSGPAESIDVRTAREIADAMGWELSHIPTPEDWGTARWPLFQMAARLLDGELSAERGDMPLLVRQVLLERGYTATAQGGGGELFREFPWEHILWQRGTTAKLNLKNYARFRLFLGSQAPRQLFSRDWHEDFISEQIRVMQSIVDLSPEAMNTSKLDAIYLWRQSGHFGRWVGTTFQLLPSLAPLMTRDLLEFSFRVPARLRSHGRLIRHMITRASPQLARFSTCWGGSALPMGLAHPVRSLPYWHTTVKRWLDKLSVVATGKRLIANPYDPKPNHHALPTFLRTLSHKQFFHDSLPLTRALYDEHELKRFLESATTPGFHDARILLAMTTLELVAAECGRSES